MKRFFKFSWTPDEFLFQTFLLEDIEDILSPDRLYARKFDMNKEPKLLEEIDEYLEK
jgi:hypothetical protein